MCLVLPRLHHLHVAAPSLYAANFLRIASAFRGNREHVQKTFHSSFLPAKFEFKDAEEKEPFVEDVRQAVYATCLASYVQGMKIIFEADKLNKWDIDYSNVVQIWKAGCIIQSDHISSLLHEILASKSFMREHEHSLLCNPTVADELKAGFESLKRVVVRGAVGNAVIPSLARRWSTSSMRVMWICRRSSMRRSWITLASICMIPRILIGILGCRRRGRGIMSGSLHESSSCSAIVAGIFFSTTTLGALYVIN